MSIHIYHFYYCLLSTLSSGCCNVIRGKTSAVISKLASVVNPGVNIQLEFSTRFHR